MADAVATMALTALAYGSARVSSAPTVPEGYSVRLRPRARKYSPEPRLRTYLVPRRSRAVGS